MAEFSGGLVTLRRAASLLRYHRPDQAANKLRFELGRIRRFGRAHLGFEPTWLPLFITERCNLRCQHCRCSLDCKPADRTPDMSIELFEHILDAFPKAVSISLTGGEPFLHPELFEMLEIAERRRLKVYIPTNATLLDRHMERLLRSTVEFMNISIYGITPETFSQLTGVKAKMFDDVLASARELCRRRGPTDSPRHLRASFICTRPDLDQVFDLLRLCKDIGFQDVKLKNLEYDDVPYFDDSLCLFEDDPAVQTFLRRLRSESSGLDVTPPKPYARKPCRRACDLPFRSMVLDGAGNIGPCCIIGPSPDWGNIADGPDVWNNPKLVSLRESLLDERRELLDVCRRCEENRP